MKRHGIGPIKTGIRMLVTLMVFCLPVMAAGGPSASEITRNMKKQLDPVRSLSADFSIITRLAALGQVNTTGGKLFIQKKDNRVRVEQPDQTMVIDGKSVWTYNPANRQIIVSPANPSEAGMRPSDFLFYYSDRYTPALMGEETIDGVPHYILKLQARDRLNPLQEARIWVDSRKWITRQVAYKDDTGSQTTIRFSNIRLNPALSSDLFTMKPAQGVDVVDLR